MRRMAPALVLVLAACGAPDTGAFALGWTFNGGRGCAIALVSRVRVQLFTGERAVGPGPLGAELEFPCTDGEVSLEGVAPGPYRVRAVALTNGAVGYQGEAAVVLDPSHPRAAIDLAPLHDNLLAVSWSFSGMTCEDARVAAVEMQPFLDGGTPAIATLDCSAGVQLVDVPSGGYSVMWTVKDGGGRLLYSLVDWIAVGLEQPPHHALLFPAADALGQVHVSWTFEGGQDCAAAGVQWVSWMLRDVVEEDVLRQGGEPCTAGAADATGLRPGYYRLGLSGSSDSRQLTHRAGQVITVRPFEVNTLYLDLPRL